MSEPTTGSKEWVTGSIMAQRGAGRDRKPQTHELTEAKQGRYHYTIGPYSDPVLTVKPGDRVVVETRDAFEGAIKTEQDLPTQKLRMPFLNPQNGPIMIEGAEKGDTVAVHIESMVPRGHNPRGTCCMIPEFGALTGTTYTALLNDPLPEKVRKVASRREMGALERPRDAAVQSAHRHAEPLARDRQHQFPHARQSRRQHGPAGHGSGQYHLSAGAQRRRAAVHRRRPCLSGRRRGVRRGGGIRDRHHDPRGPDQGWTIEWPRLEKEDFIMTIGSARPLEDAARIAYRELIRWLAAEYGFDRWDAYMMLSQCGRVRLGNFVDPKYTVGAAIAKKYLGHPVASAAAG